MEFTCPICEELYDINNKYYQACSKKCYNELPNNLLNCEVCNQEFYSKDLQAYYCSNTCGIKADKRFEKIFEKLRSKKIYGL